GLLAALSVSVNVAVRVPACVGENVKDMLQLEAGASVTPEHWSSTCVKSSEWVWALLMNRFAPPVFLMVIDCAGLVVPMSRAANVSEVGVRVTAGDDVGVGVGVGEVGVQPDRVAVADDEPSPTVTLHVDELYGDASI